MFNQVHLIYLARSSHQRIIVESSVVDESYTRRLKSLLTVTFA